MNLYLDGNALSGSIPSELGNLDSLTDLSLSDNRLRGKIPPELGGLTNLGTLRLDHNGLVGEFPIGLSALTRLRDMDLTGLNLEGCLSPEFQELQDRELLKLDLPPCEKEREAEKPPDPRRMVLIAFYHATNGDQWTNNDLWLSNNDIEHWWGVETDDYGHIIGLILHSNNLSGAIPPEISRLTTLKDVYLTFNQLSGNIPPELGRLTNLEHLGLDSNQLTGEIPSELGRLIKMQQLNLDHNQLTGQIPPELGNLKESEDYVVLVLSENQLTGCIPLRTVSLMGRYGTTYLDLPVCNVLDNQ